MAAEIYTTMIQPRGPSYRQDQLTATTHYNDPINKAADRYLGYASKELLRVKRFSMTHAVLCVGIAMFPMVGFSRQGLAVDQWPAYPMPTKQSEVATHTALVKIRPSFTQCLKDTGGSAPPTKDCMDDEYGYQDKRLNRIYRQLMTSLGKDDQLKLRDEERRWIRWRDARCSHQEAELAGYGCELEMTADRATQLENRFTSH